MDNQRQRILTVRKEDSKLHLKELQLAPELNNFQHSVNKTDFNKLSAEKQTKYNTHSTNFLTS